MISQGGGGTGGFANVYNNSLLLLGWGATTTGFTGWRAKAMSGMTHHDVHLDGFGLIGCDINVTEVSNFLATFEGSYCAVTQGRSLQVRAGNFTSHGGFYGWITTAVPAVDCNGATSICSFFGDTAPYQTGVGGAQFEATGGTLILEGVTITNPTASSFGVATFSTGTINMINTNISVNGATGTGVLSQASGIINLEGGNVINAGGAGVSVSRTGSGIINTSGINTYAPAPVTNVVRCASSASPAVCGGFTVGSFVIAAGATTATVNTTAVGLRNGIIPIEDDTLGTELGVTCNTATSVPEPNISTRVAGTSFTVTVTVAPVTNPKCYSYAIF
jgi:hypothetical protein